MKVSPFLCNDGVVILTNGDLVDWDDQKFSSLRRQVQSASDVGHFGNIYIDRNACSEFNGKISVVTQHDGLYVQVIHDNQIYYINLVPTPL